jgi:pilus assembly protein CpaB
MVLRIALFLFIALGAVGFGIVAWMVLNPAVAPEQQAATPAAIVVNALTAAHALPIGTTIAPEDLAVAPISASAVPSDVELDTPATRGRLVGSLVQHSIASGQPITASDLVLAGSHGALAIMLRPGMRAATIAVDAASGANLLVPGDYVDVLLTQTRTDPATPAARKVSTEMVVSGMRVVAVDQRFRQGPVLDPKELGLPHTITLETSEDQAQRLDVAEQLGHLTFIVRPASFDPTSQPVAENTAAARDRTLGPVVWSNDASQALAAPVPVTPDTKTIHVFRGPTDEKEFKF